MCKSPAKGVLSEHCADTYLRLLPLAALALGRFFGTLARTGLLAGSRLLARGGALAALAGRALLLSGSGALRRATLACKLLLCQLLVVVVAAITVAALVCIAGCIRLLFLLLRLQSESV